MTALRRLRAALQCALLLGLGTGALGADERLNAVLWMQQSTEYRASVLQAWRAATAALPALVDAPPATGDPADAAPAAGRPPAVVLDIDETVLDNLPYSAALVQSGRGWDGQAERDWQRWVLSAQAAPLPGVRAFAERAAALGLRVVFITNRDCPAAGPWRADDRHADCPAREATRRNLQQALGRPVADADLLLRHDRRGRDDHDKQARRAEVAQTHRIVMLAGDDLEDFIRRPDYRPARHGALWGTQWFLLPNPLYGSWEARWADGTAKLAALQAMPAADDGALQVASWNLEWLADADTLQSAGYWERCFKDGQRPRRRGAAAPALPPCDAYRRTDLTDDHAYRERKLRAVRDTLALLAAQGLDLLAVQEVAGERALQAVLPPGWRVACTSSGAGTQHLAFALREPLAARARCAQVPLGDDGAASAGRHALALQLDGRSVLNLHLKAGCSGGPIDATRRPACATLQRQAQALQAWIDAQADTGRRFVLLGDFNRDLRAERRHPARHDGSDPAAPLTDAASVRNLWPELDDGRRRLHWVDPERRAAREAGCLVSLDHLIEGGPEPDRDAPAGSTRARLVPAPADASDHCPLLAHLPR